MVGSLGRMALAAAEESGDTSPCRDGKEDTADLAEAAEEAAVEAVERAAGNDPGHRGTW